jgi:hypothetical protein
MTTVDVCDAECIHNKNHSCMLDEIDLRTDDEYGHAICKQQKRPPPTPPTPEQLATLKRILGTRNYITVDPATGEIVR